MSFHLILISKRFDCFGSLMSEDNRIDVDAVRVSLCDVSAYGVNNRLIDKRNIK